MSKLLFNMAMISTKALISAYTWTTLPFYAMAQRPWTKVELHKLLSKQVHVKLDKQGRLIYSRPSEKNSRSLYQCRTFPEALLSLDHNRKKIGIRDVISEKTALDSNGTPIIVDGRPLKKLQLKNHFRWLTIGQVFDRVDSIARGLNSMGIKKGDKVLIYAENSPEWFFTSLALIKLNAITVTLFSTLGDQGVVYGINESDSDFMFTSQQLLPKLLQLYPQINSLKKIVYFANGRETFTLDECSPSVEIMTLDQLEECGQKIPMLKYDLPKSNDTALIMFTSGTTGNPKGVVITHGQLNASVHNILRMDEDFENTGANSYHACYLPMAHIFGYIVNLTIFLTNSRIAFCSPFTLFDSSPVHVPGQVGDLKLIQPEYFSTVPLILERILKEIYQNLNKRSRLAAPLFNYMMDYKIHWMKNGYQTPIINRLVCKKINKQFGGRLKMIGVGSAPLNERTHALIKAALNVKINYAYGATENCGPAAVTQLNDLGYGSCGFPYHSFKYYLKDWPEGGYTTRDLPNARGEIVLGGETIANEYFNMPEESKESFTVDPDGTRWYHTGDIGEIQPNLMLKIIDRKKDFIKLANGEFVSLGKIEAGLRTCLLVDNICICTNPYCNHVTALIIPNHQALKALAQTYGREQNTVEQLCNDPLIVSSVLKSVKSHGNELGFKSKELPVQITLIPDEWTPNNNLLTAAFKVKRKEVYNQYREKIDAMFALWL